METTETRSRSILSSMGVLAAFALLWYGGAFEDLSVIRSIWLALGVIGFVEGFGLSSRRPERAEGRSPRLSTAVALLFLFRALQPLLGQALLEYSSLSSIASGTLSYLLVAVSLSGFLWFFMGAGSLQRGSVIGALVIGLFGGLLSSLLLFFCVANVDTPTRTSEETLWLITLFWLAAPLWEELCFRALLARSLYSLSGHKAWFSVCVSASIFALMHEGALLTPIFALGIICALSYIRSGSLIAPILVHLIHNVAAWYFGAF